MNRLTHPDNFILHWFSKVGDFLGLSIVWLVCSLPLITIASSSIALYDSVAHCVQGPDGHPYKRFFRTLKDEFFKGIGITLLWAALAFILVYGYMILYQMGQESQAASLYSLFYLGSTLIPVSVLVWLIPIESRFVHGFFSLHKTAAIFAFAHLPTTVAIVGLLLVSAVLIAFIPILVILLPCITATLQCWFIEKVFRNYMPEETDDELAE